MDHSDFFIGMKFTVPLAMSRSGTAWQVTDVGTRVIVAIPVIVGWMEGPPYAQNEIVFDENDLPVCEAL